MDMEHGRTIIQAAIAAVGAVATYLWGGWDVVTRTLVFVVILDILTGWTASVLVRGGAESSVGRIGLARKAGIFIIVALVNVLDETGIFGEPILRTVIGWGYIGNEATSILENLGELGVPLPQKLRHAIARLRDGGE